MTPRTEDCTTASSINNGNGNGHVVSALTTSSLLSKDNDESAATIIVKPTQQPHYVRCESKGDFINPFPDANLPASVKNERLNLNLGHRVRLSPEHNKLLVWMIRFLDTLCVSWWEKYFFEFWKNMVPLKFRRWITFAGWKLYFPLHKALLGRRTGLHPDVSPEYHALTTIAWWGRFFPISIQRMRFSLSQLHVCAPLPVTSKIRYIYDDMKDYLVVKDKNSSSSGAASNTAIPASQKDHVTVRGIFLEIADEPTEWTIFWIYGGAFLAGDTLGNTGPANHIGQHVGMDVFLPEYRLVPEYNAADIVWDICLAYRWLCQRRDPSKIILLGISSGAALCVSLMQNLAKWGRGEMDQLVPRFVEPAIRDLTMPAGCVLFGPFCDFTEPSGSLVHYTKHDLIVNQRVLEVGAPYLATHVPDGQRREFSPVYQSCQDCAPVCVVVSEHEATYDMTLKLVNRARREGVPVRLGVWRYMCHVFSFFNAFCPEGKQSMQFVIDWILELSASVSAANKNK